MPPGTPYGVIDGHKHLTNNRGFQTLKILTFKICEFTMYVPL